MAWSASGMFAALVLQMANSKDVNLAGDTLKCALFVSNTATPDKTVSQANSYYGAGQWVAGNEETGTGYSATGVTLGTVTCVQASNVVTLSAANPSWTGATFTSGSGGTPYGALVYDTTATTGVCFNYFGGPQSVTAGTFTIQWAGSGIAALTC